MWVRSGSDDASGVSGFARYRMRSARLGSARPRWLGSQRCQPSRGNQHQSATRHSGVRGASQRMRGASCVTRRASRRTTHAGVSCTLQRISSNTHRRAVKQRVRHASRLGVAASGPASQHMRHASCVVRRRTTHAMCSERQVHAGSHQFHHPPQRRPGRFTAHA